MSRAADLTRTEISAYRDSFHPTPAGTTTLADILYAIRGGRYHAQVTRLRQILAREGKRAYNRAKASLPAVTFAGIFAPTRGNAHLQRHSGIVHGDLDQLSDLRSAKHAIGTDPRTVYVFISPSGTGLKLGVHVTSVADDTAYKHAWQTVRAEYEARYRVAWDPSGKDVSRLCFLSADPEICLNPAPTVFEVASALPPKAYQQSHRPTPMQLYTDNRDAVERAIVTATAMIQSAPPGTRHHTRLRAARLLGGYVAGGLLAEEQAYGALAQAVVGHTDDLELALRTVEDGLRYGQAHPITVEALEAERRAWLEQHRSQLPRRTAPLSTDPWDGLNTLPLRPYTGWRGMTRWRAQPHE
jgi:hypothetical protein